MPFPAGHVVTAAEFQLGMGDWIDWSGSLTWSGAGGNPTKGNSTYVARYSYVTPHTIAWNIFITVGSTFVAGTGAWTFNLPIAPADPNGYGQVGPVWGNDSGVKLVGGLSYDIESSKVTLFRLSSTGTTPWTMAALTFADWAPNTNDSIKMSGIYEV